MAVQLSGMWRDQFEKETYCASLKVKEKQGDYVEWVQSLIIQHMRAQGIHEKHICLVSYCLPEKLLLHNYRLGLCISLNGYMCLSLADVRINVSSEALSSASVCLWTFYYWEWFCGVYTVGCKSWWHFQRRPIPIISYIIQCVYQTTNTNSSGRWNDTYLKYIYFCMHNVK